MRTLLSLLATALLGCFYALVALAAAHPRTTAEYRAHFLARTADCWLPENVRATETDPPAEVVVGRLQYPEACRYLRFRWWPTEPSGAWTHPGTATLRLPWRPDATAVELLLQGPPDARGPVAVDIGDGPDRPRLTLAPGEQRSVRAPLPANQDHSAWNIALRVDGIGTAPRPNGGWPRQVGVGLIRFRYLAAGS